MFSVDEARLITGKPFDVGVGLTIHQPTVEEILMFGEGEYMSVVNAFTAEPFDMPYYLAQMKIDFAEIKPFELFCVLVVGLPQSSTSILFGDIDFSKFKVVQRETDIVLMNPDGIVIDSLTRERLADNIRRMHCLPKNILTSCENKTAHDLMIFQQKKEVERAKRRKEMFGEQSSYSSYVSSLACEWHGYDKVLNLKVGQFFDAIVRLGHKRTADNLCSGLYSGAISYKNINKKELDWMRPIKTKTL